jgi:hypothetical protein
MSEFDDNQFSSWQRILSTDYDDLPLTLGVASTIVQQVAATFSLIGSYVILREVISDHRRRRGRVIPRILMGISVADIFLAVACFMSTWASPRELEYLWGNVGTTSTCTLQGFLFQLGLCSSPLYNMSLSFFYLLFTCYNYCDWQLAKFEVWIHALIWPVSLFTAIIPIPFGMYNNAYEVCWIESFPMGCDHSFPHTTTACTRGDNAWLVATTFTVLPIWPSIGFSIGCMTMIYAKVRQQETRNSSYAGFMQLSSTSNDREGSSTRTVPNSISRTISRQVALQSLRYTAAFLATYTCWTISALRFHATGERNFGLDFIASNVLLPLQGFFNALVFVGTRTMATPEGKVFRKIFCFCHNTDPRRRAAITSSGRGDFDTQPSDIYDDVNFQSLATTALEDGSEYGGSSLLLGNPSSLAADSLLELMEDDENEDGDKSLALDEQPGTRLSGAI